MRATSPIASDGRRSKATPFVVVILLMMLVAIPCAAVQYEIPAVLGSIAHDYAVSSGTASWLIASFTISGTFMALAAGPVSNRFGPKKTFIAGAACVAAGSLVSAALGSFGVLVAMRVLEGCGFALICVAGPLLAEMSVDASRLSAANGVWSTWIPIGCVVGEVLAPSLYEAFGLEGASLVLAIPIVVFAVMIAVIVRATRVDDEAPEGEDVQAHDSGNFKGLLSARYLLFLAAWFSFNYLNFSVVSFAPSYMQGIGMGATESGVVASLPMLLAIVSGPVGGVLIDRTGRRQSILVTALAVNLLTTVGLLSLHGMLLYVCAVAMGLVGLMTIVAALSSVPRMLPSASLLGLGMSVYFFVQNLAELASAGACPILLGSDLGNWPLLIATLAVLGLLGIACAVVSERIGQRD